jgi:transposase
MGLYSAVDLHSDNGYYAVTDENDRRVLGKRLPNDLSVILKTLEPYGRELVHGIAVESTFNWYWLVDGLMDHDYKVQLVNPTRVKEYDGLKYTDDESDAFHLAHLQRLGLLPTGYIYPKEVRGFRDLLRRRTLLVHQRTTHLLSFQSLLQRQTGMKFSANKLRKLEENTLNELVKSNPHARQMGLINLQTIEFLSQQISGLERSVLKECRVAPGYQRLNTLPGVGPILGMTIYLETGPIARFDGAGHYTSYCRGVRAERFSNGKKKDDNNGKNGNKYLSWAFVEAAHYAIRYNERAKRWYQRKLARCGGKQVIAIKALSAKLSKAAYYIMKQQVDFDEQRLFG